jgi:hypothetical protein
MLFDSTLFLPHPDAANDGESQNDSDEKSAMVSSLRNVSKPALPADAESNKPFNIPVVCFDNISKKFLSFQNPPQDDVEMDRRFPRHPDIIPDREPETVECNGDGFRARLRMVNREDSDSLPSRKIPLRISTPYCS